MVARKIDDNNPLGLSTDRTDVGGVNKVEDEPEAFEGCYFKETTIPRLGQVSSSRCVTESLTHLNSVKWKILVK